MMKKFEKKETRIKFISMLVSMVMIFAMIPVISLAEGEQKTVFRSDENFSTEAGDGTWDNGVWRAEMINEWSNYVTVTNTSNEGYCNESGDGASWNPIIYGDKIRDSQNGNNPSTVRFGVRAFIAPRAGTIKIHSSNITRTSAWGWSGTGIGADYRIRKNNDSSYLWQISNPEDPIVQPEISDINVNKGDIIRFEVVRTANWDTVNHEWVNTIEYLPEETPTPVPTANPDQKPVTYKSTDNFMADSTSGGTWDNGIWRAEYYDSENKIYNDSKVATSGGAYAEFWEWQDANVSDKTMKLTQWSTSDTKFHHHPVRTFIAPMTGVIRIEKTDISKGGKNAVYSIIKNDIETAWTMTGNTLTQDAVTLSVNKGDKIRFTAEKAYEDVDWNESITWINTITYIAYDEAPVEGTVTFAEQAEYKYDAENKTGQMRVLAAPDYPAEMIPQAYGFWFVDTDTMTVSRKTVSKESQGDTEENLESGMTFRADVFIRNKNVISEDGTVTEVPFEPTAGDKMNIYAIPWVTFTNARTATGSAFTFEGNLTSTEVVKEQKDN